MDSAAAISRAVEPDLARRLRMLLHERGMRWTTPRSRILRALCTSHTHLTIAEIHQRILDDPDSKSVDLATVYRTLDTLRALGMLHQINRADCPPLFGTTATPHQHAVCDACGAVVDIDSVALADLTFAAGRTTGYRLNATASVEVHGLCPDCQDLAAGSPD